MSSNHFMIKRNNINYDIKGKKIGKKEPVTPKGVISIRHVGDGGSDMGESLSTEIKR